MWCRSQAAAMILPVVLAGWLMGESSEALTTFGKSMGPPISSPPPRQPAIVCKKQADCAGIKNTSCVRTASDPTMRCLCGDDMPPLKGSCDSAYKGLHHRCSSSAECAEGLICEADTIGRPLQGSNDMICACDVDNGYVEKDFSCNAAASLGLSSFWINIYLSIMIIVKAIM